MGRIFLLTGLFCMAIFSNLSAEASFRIQPRSYMFSAFYDIYCGETYLDTIETQTFELQKTYTLYSEKGIFAKGVARLLSFGTLLSSMKEIDVIDPTGNSIGFIQGEFMTTAAAKYSFYNSHGQKIATAYLDYENASISLVHPTNERKQIGVMNRFFVPNATYYWDAVIFDEEIIDPNMLHLFAGFIADAYWPSAPTDRPKIEFRPIIKEILNNSFTSSPAENI